ncbi:uncharacterized protein EAE97_011513 [Botrytis byssoidea]|uniref:Non-haem dioxygenase N-terminal domain-containing protein n=1 Tax=Botrytis byssoidea TaxID=139641 RepID=A0A9P5HQP8_9HELO|nr:uncharacterized protein EAE97_011513 [Botrytis byssoidea]KAF7920172.1 hypothetical protein EAE97_011513 [Botrytis byssoidea]
MSISKYFHQYLNFQPIPTSPAFESEKLIQAFQACQESGFFLLELRNGNQGETLWGDAEKMFDITTLTLTLDHEQFIPRTRRYTRNKFVMCKPLANRSFREDCKSFFYHARGVLDHLPLAHGTLVSLNSLDKELCTFLRMLVSRSQSITKDHPIILGAIQILEP